MAKFSSKAYQELLKQYDLRKVSFSAVEKGGSVTVSDEDLAAIEAAPKATTIEVPGTVLVKYLQGDEQSAASRAGVLKFLSADHTAEKYPEAHAAFLAAVTG